MENATVFCLFMLISHMVGNYPASGSKLDTLVHYLSLNSSFHTRGSYWKRKSHHVTGFIIWQNLQSAWWTLLGSHACVFPPFVSPLHHQNIRRVRWTRWREMNDARTNCSSLPAECERVCERAAGRRVTVPLWCDTEQSVILGDVVLPNIRFHTDLCFSPFFNLWIVSIELCIIILVISCINYIVWLYI